MPFYQLIVSL